MILTKKVRLWPTDMLKWGHISLCKINEHYQNERKTNTRTSLPSGTSRELVQACAVRALPRNRWIQVMVIILWVRLQKVPSIFDGWPSSSPLNLSQLWVFSISHSWTHPYHITLVIYIYIHIMLVIYIYIISNHITILCLVYSNYTHDGWLTSSFSNPCEKCATYLSVYKKRGTPESTAELSFSKLLFGAQPHFQVHRFIVDECWWHPTDPHQFLLFGRINHLVDLRFLSGSC